MMRSVAAILVALFAVSAGPFAYRTWAPLQTPEYFVGGMVEPFVAPPELPGGGKSLYLRKNVPLPRKPRHAWLQLVGHDVMGVYVNGERAALARVPHPYGAGAVLVDITADMKRGKNSIAVVVGQKSLHRQPAVAIDGQVVLTEQSPQSLADGWKCSGHFEHHAEFWYETDFDDSHWLDAARDEPRAMRGQVDVPPQAIIRRPASNWIGPPAAVSGRASGQAALRREFHVDGRPQHAWMRITATAPYTLAVNGKVMHTDHDLLASPAPYRPKFHIFDVSPMVRSGRNVVAVMLSSLGERPHMAADLEVVDKRGVSTFLETDHDWVGLPGAPVDWHLVDSQLDWAPCRSEAGPLDGADTRRDRYFASKRAETQWLSRSTLGIAAASAAAGLLGWLGCLLVGGLVRWLAPSAPAALAFAGLAPPAALCLAGMLLTFDSTIGQADVYQPRWLLAVLGMLLAWWAAVVLAALLIGEQPEQLPGRRRQPRGAVALLLITIVAGGIALRTRDLLAEPMHHDEVGSYFFTTSVWEHGFPGGQVHPEMPFGFCATSELVYFFNAPFALMFDDARLVIRVPAVLWATYTIVLLYVVSRNIFGLSVALVAAAIYAASPYLVGMANFGRYFSQLQFFALLTCYAYWETIRGHGPVSRRWLWVTAASFLAMYFSWEGSGFMAVGMICAALLHRRGRLKTILLCPSIYAALIVVGSGILAQNAHRTFQQTRRLWYGTGISDVTVMPMWRYPKFDLLFYLREATWLSDAVIPMLCLLGAVILAVRHPRREPIRVFLVILVVTSIAMVLLLPLRATRYVYHLTPLLIMLSAVVVVTLARGVAKLGRGAAAPEWSRSLASLPAAAVVLVFLVMASGYAGQLYELKAYKSAAYRPGLIKFPHWEAPLRYVRRNMQEGDAMIALHPHIVDMTMQLADDYPVPEDWRSDYWMQSVMMLQATLSDTEPFARDRRAGTRMIGDRETLERVFREHERVWYVTIRHAHNTINHADVSELMRQYMDVVYEDAQTVVMLRTNKNRTAAARLEDEESSQRARTWIVK